MEKWCARVPGSQGMQWVCLSDRAGRRAPADGSARLRMVLEQVVEDGESDLLQPRALQDLLARERVRDVELVRARAGLDLRPPDVQLQVFERRDLRPQNDECPQRSGS